MAKNERFSTSTNLYIWLFLLSTVVVILFVFAWHIHSHLPFDTDSGKPDTSDTYLNTIILIAGFLCAFSAISIYSIFNASVDSQKNELEDMKDQIKDLSNEFETKLKEKAAELEEKERKLNAFDEKSTELFNELNHIFNLTSPYPATRKKREAIMYFSTSISVKEDLKKILLNYYEAQRMNPTIVEKKYFQELEKLLTNWNMID